jgi:hypothetical protein
MSSRRVCCFAGVLAIAGVLIWLRHSATKPHPPPVPDNVRAATVQQKAAERKAMDRFMHASLPFEANLGQTDPAAKFIARGVRYTVFFTPKSVILRLADPKIKGRDDILEMQLVGARDAEIGGQEPLASRSHYFHGNSPKAWQTDVPHFGKVSYKGVYPNTDLVFYGRQGELEYDVVLGPRVNPHNVVLQFSGATHLSVNKDGDLVLTLPGGHQILQRRPKIYQQAGDHRVEISGGYRILAANRVRFEVGGYDRDQPLVIDPVLTYSSYLGGTSIGNDEATSIALDGSGNAYIAGLTDSVGFPTGSVPPIQSNLAGGTDAFVAKLSADGSTLLYSTYLGGSSNDQANGIAVDGTGKAYIVGATSSADFPTTPGSFAPTQPVGGQSVFVTKLSPTGANLVYSTYVGAGSGAAIAVDPSGFAYLTGVAYCCSFPTTAGTYQTTGTTSEPFITKLNQNGSALQWSTLMGGNSGGDFGTAIALDSSQNVYVAGSAYSSNFPVTAGAYQTILAGDSDVFVAKMNSSGSAPVYATFLGGNSWDYGYGIAVDSMGFAYVTGTTSSPNFPTTGGAYQTGLNGYQDAFAAKLNQTGTSLVYSTFVGSFSYGSAIAIDSSGDAYLAVSGTVPLTPGAYSSPACCGYVTELNPSGSALIYSSQLGFLSYNQAGLAVDDSGNAYLAGFTSYSGYPVTPGAYQQSLAGGNDAIITKLNSSGTALVYSTFLGGEGGDQGLGVALDGSGNAYVTGSAGSLNFPVTTVTAAPRAESGPYTQVFVTKFNPSGTGLTYSTFVSGSGNDTGRSIAVGAGGTVYVTGQTNSSDFPVTVGVPQASIGGGYDAFLFKLSAAGHLLYSTFIGGSSTDDGRGVAVDSSGNAYVAGNTSSQNFFTTSTIGNPSTYSTNVFVAEVNPTGTAYLYSTLLGGSSGQSESGIAVDSSGNAYITGNTYSSDFPVTVGSYQTSAPSYTNAFVTKLNPAGSGLIYSTYLGGTNNNTFGNAIAVDSKGSAYVTGYTTSTTFPVSKGSFQATPGGAQNAFITKLNPSGSALSYSTLLGGTGPDQANAIAVDTSGNVYVAGTAGSGNFPTAPGGMEVVFPGYYSFPGSGFVSSLNPTGSGLQYSTYLGQGSVNAISVKPGYAVVTGATSSPDLIGTSLGYQPTLASGAQNAFVSKISNPPAGCTYSVNQASFSLGSGGGSGTVNVTAGAGCPWIAVTPDSSRVVLNPATGGVIGSGNGSVKFSVSADTNTNDSGSVSLFTVAGQIISVTQTAPCAISLASNGITIGPGAISSADVFVNGGSCNWTTYTTTPWISNAGSNSFGNGVVPYSVQPNLTAVTRTGVIYVGPQVFTITQLGSPAAVATIVSPAPGTVLPGPTVAFDWTPISGADQYLLDVGTSLGQGNICVATVTTNRATCGNIPTGGGTIYVQLSTHLSGVWETPVQYTYSAAANSIANLLSPAPATPYPGPPTTVLPGTQMAFTWSTGIGADQYLLQVGSALNQSNVCSTTTTSTLFTCTNLPCNGSTIYAQISTHFASGWQLPNQYVYLACTATLGIITSPTPLSTLSGSSVTFKWAGGVGADDYELEVGTSPRQGNICTTTTIITQSTCTNIPTNGSPIYVLLRTHVNGAWQLPNFYTYTAALLNQFAQITSPANNSVLPGSSVTFQWASVSGATAYGLEVGSALGQADICKVSIAAPSTQYTCNNIPTDGRIIYVRLFTFETSWREPNYYTFTAF